MNAPAPGCTIGRLAKAAGVKIDTVRFYERQGLLARAARSSSGYRLYSVADAERLKFIRRAKALGFSLEDIAELLRLAQDGQDRSKVKAVAALRVADLERRIRELEAMRSILAHHLEHCSGRGPVKGCPIIEALISGPDEPANGGIS
jgi:Hg(II)-responsive transcriptional regulator